MDGETPTNLSIAVFLPDLSGGGTERLHIGLAPFFMAAGAKVTFVLSRDDGALRHLVPQGVDVVVLAAPRQARAVWQLMTYLRRAKPDVLISNMEHMNVIAILARLLAGSPAALIACQHNTLSAQAKRPGLKFRLLPLLYRFLLPLADRVVTVSRGVAADMISCAGLRPDKIKVIYNGVIGPDFYKRMTEPPETFWPVGDERPLIVAVGRMVPQKGYRTLVEAFAQARQSCDLRLLILGEGPQRRQLEDLIDSKRLGPHVRLPGFIANPLPYIASAQLLALASDFEGFGLVLVEALACGTPVVSTDCPHGPSEILAEGRFGTLVPVGDASSLSQAILNALNSPKDEEALKARGGLFTLEVCARSYLTLFENVLHKRARRSGKSPVRVRELESL